METGVTEVEPRTTETGRSSESNPRTRSTHEEKKESVDKEVNEVPNGFKEVEKIDPTEVWCFEPVEDQERKEKAVPYSVTENVPSLEVCDEQLPQDVGVEFETRPAEEVPFQSDPCRGEDPVGAVEGKDDGCEEDDDGDREVVAPGVGKVE